MIKFQSQLADKIVLFLEFKHSMGIIYKTGEVTLYDFDRYNLEHGVVLCQDFGLHKYEKFN